MHFEREISRTFHAGAAPRLDIETARGSVDVTGEERSDVSIVARLRFTAASEDEADELVRAVEASMRLDGDTVMAHAPNRRGLLGELLRQVIDNEDLEIDYRVTAPRLSSARLRVVHGRAAVAHLEGALNLTVVNGAVHVEDLGQAASVRMVNGRGSISRTRGRLDVKLTNGDLRIEEPAGAVNLRLVNGDLRVTNPGGALNGRAVSGAIDLAGPVVDDISFESVSAAITLRVPAESRFRLDAASRFGEVTSELDVRQSTTPSGPSPSVSLFSRAGRIAVKALRPAEAAV